MTTTPSPDDRQNQPASLKDWHQQPDWKAFGLGSVGGFVVAGLVGLLTVSIMDVTARTNPQRPAATATEAAQEGDPREWSVVATEFAFDPADLVVEAGVIDLTLQNDGVVFHDLVIEGLAGVALEADPGQSVTREVDLPAGTFTMFCSVPGHRDAGMVATITGR